jgi:hypothetical protein
MSKSCVILKAIGYGFGASVAASLMVLLLGMCVFGFELARWAEWQGRIVGVLCAFAGLAGVSIGLRMAFRTKTRVQIC